MINKMWEEAFLVLYQGKFFLTQFQHLLGLSNFDQF